MRAWTPPLILLSLLACGCQELPKPGSTPTARSVHVVVDTCDRRDVPHQVELPGDVFPRQQVMLYARVSGYLESVLVDRGDKVRPGQLLAAIRLPEAERDVAQTRAVYSRGQAELVASQARLPRAEAERMAVEAEYRRAQAQQKQLLAELSRARALEQQAQAEQRLAEANSARLVNIAKEDSGLVAAQDLDVSLTSVEVARQRVLSAHSAVLSATQSVSAGQAAVASARGRLQAGVSQVRVAEAQLASSGFQSEADLQTAKKASDLLTYSEIRAPFAGTITSRYLDPGALVQSSDRSAQTSTRPVLALADFDKVRVRIELPQQIAPLVKRGTPASVSVEALPDRVFKAPVARTSGSLDVASRTMVGEIDVDNPHHLLHPGMYVKVILDIGAHKNALAVPTQAVISERSMRAVMVVEKGRARRVSIKTGLENGQWVEVLEGLRGGEEVVVSAPDKLSDGASVETEHRPPPARVTPAR